MAILFLKFVVPSIIFIAEHPITIPPPIVEFEPVMSTSSKLMITVDLSQVSLNIVIAPPDMFAILFSNSDDDMLTLISLAKIAPPSFNHALLFKILEF